MRFEETLSYLHDFYHSPALSSAEVGLRRAERLLRELDDPHLRFRSVHVAGSKGKGSTTTMLACVLAEAGFRTGRFLSPHLESYTERIAVDGTDIGQDAWIQAFEEVKPIAEAMRNGGPAGYSLGRPALFEFLFALMAVHFASSGVEWAVAETGLGGRLDATNLLQPDVAIVTNISLEHTHILGGTIGAIAAEKAAIIKPGAHAVTSAREPDALNVITARARAVGAPLYRVGDEVTYEIGHSGADGQSVTFSGLGTRVCLRLGVAGRFQAENAAAAYAATRALQSRGVSVPEDALARGLQKARVPGRFEVIRRRPLVVLDGAHNPASAQVVALALSDINPPAPLILLFAAMADKDVAGMASVLGPWADEVITTRAPDADRAADAAELADLFRPYVDTVSAEDNAHRALQRALEKAGDHGTVLVCGSLYLVGFVRALLRAVLAA